MFTYTVGRFKNELLHTIREYSSGGSVASGDFIADYKVSVVPLLNKHQLAVARDTKCLKKVYDAIQYHPDNMITGYDTGVHDGEDVIFSAVGAQGYSIHVSGPVTVFLEELVGEVWTLRKTVTHTPVAGEGFVNYRGLTALSDPANTLRIRLSGDHYALYRWPALYQSKFASDAAVPAYAPQAAYAMPDDFYRLDNVERTVEPGIYQDYADFRVVEENGQTLVYLPWDASGEFKLRYTALPPALPVPGITNPDASDESRIQMPDYTIWVLMNLVAADLVRTANPYLSDTLRNHAWAGLNNLEKQDDNPQGRRPVHDVYGW